MWQRQVKAWHLVYAAVWVTAVVVTLVQDPGPRGRLPAFVVMLLLAAIYATAGVRALTREAPRMALLHLTLSWVVVLAGMVVDPRAPLWLFFWILFPHLWAMLTTRQAVIGSVLIVCGFTLVQFRGEDFDTASLAGILSSALFSLGLSLAIGLFILRLVNEAEARADTIDTLRATQADLAAVERDRGVLEERERLSREIHDTLAQGFTSVLALTRAADAALARGDVGTARQRLALVDATARDNLSEARLIVAELTPGHLQSRTLVEALDRLVAAVSAESEVAGALVVEGEPAPLGGAREVVVLRTAQEALANVRRHAGARHCTLVLDYREPERVVLTVTDDGRGFDTTVLPTGYGLEGLRSRAAEVGGTLDLTSTPASGTCVTLEVPR